MKPGDVWVVDIPELGTHEQSGTRPAVIVAKVTATIVTIIPCTTNKRALRFPFTRAIEPTKKNGFSELSIALIFHLRAIDVSFLKRKIGELDGKTMSDVRTAARQLIGGDEKERMADEDIVEGSMSQSYKTKKELSAALNKLKK